MRTGKITQSVLNRSVLKIIKDKRNKESAAVGSDCAFFINEDGSVILSSSCPVSINIKEKAFYAITGAINNIYAMGGKADFISLTVLLSENAEEAELKQVMRDAKMAADYYGTFIAGGHTEVIEGQKEIIVIASVTGHADKDKFVNPGKAKPGDELILTKWIGLEGTAIIADNKIDELKTRYPVPFIEKGIKFRDFMSIESEAAVAIESGISAMHDVSTGGILGALWEFAEASNAGLTINLKMIPIRQETVEICEFFELNPYSLMSQGSLLIASANAKKVVNALESNGISAQIIGKFVEGKGRVIYNEEESRYLDKPYEDEIYKIKF